MHLFPVTENATLVALGAASASQPGYSAENSTLARRGPASEALSVLAGRPED